MKQFNKKITENPIIYKINNSDIQQRYCMLIFGIFLQAFSFNLFYAPYNIVTGGSQGLSLFFKNWYNIDTSNFVFIVSVALIILSFFLLGLKTTLRTILGTILLPMFMKITEVLMVYFELKETSLILIAIYGGIISGLSAGLILKTGYSSGGFHIVYQIMHKYLNISMGLASRIVNTIIIGMSAIVFGIDKAMYAIIALFISTFVMDRVLLGISKTKTFYIITRKEKAVLEYIEEKLHHSVTIVDSKGGYTDNKKKMLMTVIPTKEYYRLKEFVMEIDEDAFFLITDTYEVFGGK